MIRNAYQLQEYQIVGGPNWINDDRFDVNAKAAGDTPPLQILAMSQTLLADRFKLVVHRETRQLPIYALVIARSDRRLGPRLQPAAVTAPRCWRRVDAACRRSPRHHRASGHRAACERRPAG